jgi:hypothetical protein
VSQRLGGLLAALACGGCVLDFNDFRLPASTADSGVSLDAGFDADLDAGSGPIDKPSTSPDVTVVDQPPSVDQGDPRCAPPGNAMIRLAHMAANLGAVDVCMRRQNSDAPYAPVPFNEWPAGGVGYAMVSQHFALNSQVVTPNDRWQFALVPHGADCATAATLGGAIASLTVNIGPQSQSTLLFTSEFGGDGRVFGLLGLLSDQACTTCPANTLDVRAVHASLGSSGERINLSINYSLPSSPLSFVNVLFASNIPYGQTAPVGGAGFDCDTAWRGAAELPPTYSVQFAAQSVSDDVLARSERVGLKADLLLRSRMATVFFLGGDGVRTPTPEFVLCYEGARDAGMTVCDRIAATAVPRMVNTDAGASQDAADGHVEPVDAAIDDDVLL